MVYLGRARLYEVIQKVKEINAIRRQRAKSFIGKSSNDLELKNNSKLELDFIIAPPQMAYYMKYSTNIYNIYLKYFAPEDIFSYSIDEVFCDVTNYLNTYKMTPKELATKVVQDVYNTTGITATCGIGTNLYLAKIAMDIGAKHVKADKNGLVLQCKNGQISILEIQKEGKKRMDYRSFLNGNQNLLNKIAQ